MFVQNLISLVPYKVSCLFSSPMLNNPFSTIQQAHDQKKTWDIVPVCTLTDGTVRYLISVNRMDPCPFSIRTAA